ncbi:1334_t:CDS:1 [Acaulospora morrowiae]|uniref:1334_t:CDS:1 n=1 Tax=Acaulospora morrowiae TaxID=94023 RepID=A0A9N8Z838_9GLOM|nr:1334_t:CDS:1 [Acaulospora morrowiae]
MTASASSKRIPITSYIRQNDNVSFSFAQNKDTFQSGILGNEDTYLEGTLHLDYEKPTQINRIVLNLKGEEKTKSYENQTLYTGAKLLVNRNYCIQDEEKTITQLDVPFKVSLPHGLPESVTIYDDSGEEIGGINYVLGVIVERKGFLKTTQKVKIRCPLKKTLIMNTTAYQLCGNWGNLLNYSLELPQNNTFAINSSVSIPIKLRLFRSGISIEKVDVTLKTFVNFSFSIPRRVSRKIKEITVASTTVPRHELQENYGNREYSLAAELDIPPGTKPTNTRPGTLIQIIHQLCIKCHLRGATDFVLKELITIANIRQPLGFAKTFQKHVPLSLSSDEPNKAVRGEEDDYIYVYDQNNEQFYSYGISSGSELE